MFLSIIYYLLVESFVRWQRDLNYTTLISFKRKYRRFLFHVISCSGPRTSAAKGRGFEVGNLWSTTMIRLKYSAYKQRIVAQMIWGCDTDLGILKVYLKYKKFTGNNSIPQENAIGNWILNGPYFTPKMFTDYVPIF